jgi:uncharacterized membrane protein YtjA (UPF0391 family)
MLYYALMFLIVGFVTGALGLFGIAAIAGQIAWVLFLIGVVLIVVPMVGGRRALPVVGREARRVMSRLLTSLQLGAESGVWLGMRRRIVRSEARALVDR